MAEYVLPPWLRVSAVDKGILGNTAEFSSPLNGATRTYGRPGDRLRFDVRIENASNRTTVAERAYYEGLLAAIRSKANRVWMSPPGYAGPRGSFPVSELFTNADFSNGTTGWNVETTGSLSVADGRLRMTTLRGGVAIAMFQQIALTAATPYALRSVIVDGKGSEGLSLGRFINGGIPSASDYSTARGMGTLVSVPTAAEAASNPRYPLVFGGGVFRAGSYASLPFASLARCILTDSSPNEFAQSLISGAGWTLGNATVTANYYTMPDGSVTGSRLIEASDIGQSHYSYRSVTRTNVAADWFVCGEFRRGDVSSERDRVYLSVRDDVAGTNGAYAVFNLALGTVSVSAAALGSATDARAVIKSLGDNWFYCAVGCRMPASGTTVTGFLASANASDSATYNGDGSRNIGVGLVGLAQSSQPFNLRANTGTAYPTGVAQTGAGLYVKGLPVSTNGLLLPGDYVQIGFQLEMVTASLDSDAAGLGYLQVSRPMRTAVADNTPIIVHQPMAKFLFADPDIGWSLRPGLLSDFTIPLVEDVT